jgi:hypothetical protein
MRDLRSEVREKLADGLPVQYVKGADLAVGFLQQRSTAARVLARVAALRRRLLTRELLQQIACD